MAGILRGEIYWADLDPVRGSEQAGHRPVVVLSNDLYNRHSGTVIAMAITSQPPKAGYPLSLRLADGQLPKVSWVKISQIRTISQERLRKRLGFASDDELASLTDGLVELIT